MVDIKKTRSRLLNGRKTSWFFFLSCTLREELPYSQGESRGSLKIRPLVSPLPGHGVLMLCGQRQFTEAKGNGGERNSRGNLQSFAFVSMRLCNTRTISRDLTFIYLFLLYGRLRGELARVSETCEEKRKQTECCILQCRKVLKPWWVLEHSQHIRLAGLDL